MSMNFTDFMNRAATGSVQGQQAGYEDATTGISRYGSALQLGNTLREQDRVNRLRAYLAKAQQAMSGGTSTPPVAALPAQRAYTPPPPQDISAPGGTYREPMQGIGYAGDFMARRGYADGGAVGGQMELNGVPMYAEGGEVDMPQGAIPVAGQQVLGPGGPKTDSIPAVIDGSQPAALSTGEFVIPAEVVKYYGTKFFDGLIAKAHQALEGVE